MCPPTGVVTGSGQLAVTVVEELRRGRRGHRLVLVCHMSALQSHIPLSSPIFSPPLRARTPLSHQALRHSFALYYQYRSPPFRAVFRGIDTNVSESGWCTSWGECSYARTLRAFPIYMNTRTLPSVLPSHFHARSYWLQPFRGCVVKYAC
jgi:hypothetical protein